MQLYIDANVYIEYFRKSSSERLAPLEELVKLIEAKKVILLLPQQTKEEYYRNRRSVAEETRKALIEQSRQSSLIPAIFDKDVKEIKDVKKYNKSLSDSYKKLITKYDKDVEKEKTHADILINKLFSLATQIPETDEIITKAYKRYMKGNPPRKSDHSYGDAITWESLMEISTIDNLAIITKDSDYIETTKNEKVLHSFLAVEWKNKASKNKKITLYASLAEFVNTLSPKKDQIKKEIIQQEKLDIQPTGVFAVTKDNGLMDIFTASLNQISPQSFQNIRQSSTLVSRGYSSMNKFYCPYCGSEIIEAVMFSIFNNHHCHKCNKTFTLP